MDTFEIYQVKSGIEFRNYRFENIEGLDAFDLKVELKNYDFIYKDELKEGMDLEDIFIKLMNSNQKVLRAIHYL